MQEQAPDADGVRRSKGVVIRSTYRQLQTTTAPSWRGWFGDAFGDFTWSDPFQHRMRFGLPDGTRVEADIVFLALDGPDAETKLRGLEVTWGWVNEAREIPKSVFNFLLGRVGRYPPMRDGRADLVRRVLRFQRLGCRSLAVPGDRRLARVQATRRCHLGRQGLAAEPGGGEPDQPAGRLLPAAARGPDGGLDQGLSRQRVRVLDRRQAGLSRVRRQHARAGGADRRRWRTRRSPSASTSG